MKPVWLVAVACALAVLRAAPNEPTAVVAVLEVPQCNDDAEPVVRPLFARVDSGWVSLDVPETAQLVDLTSTLWSVVRDARSLGTIRTTDPGFTSNYAWTFPRDRLLRIDANQDIPRIANKHDLYAGWCGSPPNRPLALVIPGHYNDPDSWKPIVPTVAAGQALFADFKSSVGPAMWCPVETDSYVNFDYTPSDVQTVSVYEDRHGRKLIALQLDPAKNNCDWGAHVYWGPHWFLVGTGVRAIGSELEFVEAVDFDDDGSSEILFWYSGYNRDGYTLLSKHFERRADFRWRYH